MSDWCLVYDSYDPAQQGVREALTALGNGYFCTRGAFEWVSADDVHYPGTYLAGGYNRLVTEVAGRAIENEDLVNLPNWLSLRFRIGDGDWFNLLAVDLLAYRRALDMKRGLLETTIRFRDRHGREATLHSRRLVSMASPHLAAIAMTITAHGWSDRIEIRSELEGRVINAGVKRYRTLNSSHLVPCAAELADGIGGERLLVLVSETCASHLRIAMAGRTRLVQDGRRLEVAAVEEARDDHVRQCFALELADNRPLTVEKVVALHTGRDAAIASPELAAREAVAEAPFFDALLTAHATAWARLWDRCDILIEAEGDGDIQMILRLHIFHLLQTLSPNSIDLDVGVPARGWHGEAYRGHVFWDELFILPFLDYRLPALSRATLRYRYNRLGKARQMARRAGAEGAMFPWQSGSDGREESQQVHLNPRSGRWIPDNSALQRHVGLAIAFNVWRYCTITGEKQFLAFRGIELMVEIARFFVALCRHHPGDDRYDLLRVMGPDEYHEAYPGAEQPGLDNNAYTNVMVSWLLTRVDEALNVLDATRRAEVVAALGITEEERARWDDISRKMRVCFHDGVVSQFQGYESLEEFDWERYRAKYGDIQRLDRILEAEGDTPNRYKLSKQADVLMLFYLFPPQRLQALFARLGYDFDEGAWQRTIDYYLARTSHGSTLSYVVHSWVLARSQPERAWELFSAALKSDIADIQGGTTAEGIHLGAMAGTVDFVQRCLLGLDVHDGELRFDPVANGRLRRIRLKVRHLGHWIDVDLHGSRLALTVHPSWTAAVPVRVRGDIYRLEPGKTHGFTV